MRPWKARSKTTTAGASRRGAGDLDRVLDRLGAGVEEHGLRRGLARPELVQPARDLDVRLVHPDHEALVEETVDLLVDGPDDRLGVVPEVLACDPAGEVEELAAVGVPERGALGAGDDEVGRRDPARHELLPPGANACLRPGALSVAIAANPTPLHSRRPGSEDRKVDRRFFRWQPSLTPPNGATLS